MHAIAVGVDDPQQCKALLDIGFEQGVGQLFPALALSATAAPQEGAARFDTLVI
jgi:EAL domain-containing protein (putative c-di-GMP-specific phosphodiesterase class I)